jgi:DNA helicase HerA-like ATPase
MKQEFLQFFESNYSPMDGIPIGRPSFYNEILNEYTVKIPIGSLTKHGLITGSTGTGKSRVIQLLMEELTKQGVPVFLSDIKGDMSGFNVEGNSEKVRSRAETLKYAFTSQKFETNYWGSQDGLINFRINLAETDYVVLAKLLELNPTQESHLGSVYKYAKDNKLEIPDLDSLNDLILYLIKNPDKSIGTSKESLGVITRKINNLEFSNIGKFFGKPAIDINNFLSDKINILWLQNYQKEKFNAGNIVSFLLSKLYTDLPEVGDTSKPKLVIFIDEAHQIFDNANPKLVDLMVSILKQVRSKGVGIIFNTQSADDIPERILEQLGLKIQFALRAFSLKELQEIKGVVESFPESKFYNLQEEVKSLESGTAFVSTLNEKGALLPPVKTVIFPPASFMDAVPFEEITKFGDQDLKTFYSQKDTSASSTFGSPLDNISVSRGGKWQMNTYLQRKEEQAVNRKVQSKNRETRKFLILIIVILGIAALILFLFIINSVIGKLN